MKTGFRAVVAAAVLFISWGALNALPTRADELPFMSVVTDAHPGKVFEIKVTEEANGDIHGFSYVDSANVKNSYNLSQLKGAGEVIFEQSGYKVLTISVANDFDAHTGGNMTLTYLRNALMNHTGAFKLQVVRTGSSFSAYTQADHRPFSQIRIDAARLGVKDPVIVR